MANTEKNQNWKSILWRKDSLICWNEYEDLYLITLAETGLDYEPVEAEGYVENYVEGRKEKTSVIKEVKATEGFQAYHKTPFDYSQLCHELVRRGYERTVSWIKKGNDGSIRENQGNNRGIDSIITAGLKREEKPTYEKVPLFSETKKLIEEKFGSLPHGVRGRVVAQVIDELLQEKFGE